MSESESEAYKYWEISWAIPSYWADAKEPRTDMEALMSAAPHDSPRRSLEERMAVKDAIGEAFTRLEPIEIWVLNAVLIEQRGLRSTARQLSRPKTSVARIRDRALLKLRKELESNEAVQRYRTRPDA